jgi:V/A-type H+-transporting ATPase subunit I
MKRVSVLAPADRARDLLEVLQAEGAVHLVPLDLSAEVPQEPGARATAARRVEAFLASRKGKLEPVPAEAHKELQGLSDRALLERAEALLATRTEAENRVSALAKEYESALPFGACCQEDIDELANAGLTVRTYWVPNAAKKKLDLPSDVLCAELPWNKNRSILLCAEFGPGQDHHLERLEPPARPAPQIAAELEAAQQKVAAIDQEVTALCAGLPAIARERARLVDAQRLSEAKARAGGDSDVFAVSGWCPAVRCEALAKVVTAFGGAVAFAEPGPEENPPVAVSNGAIVGWFEPLLGAFQLPSYREPDPTILFAPFMAVFFGFCLGDAAYGAILLIVTTLLRRKLKDLDVTLNKSLRLMQLLGLSTIVIGLLTGVVFGQAIYEIEAVKALGLTEDKLLFFLSSDPKNFFNAALIFGVVQLAFGIIVRLILKLKAGEYQESLGVLGWLGLLPTAPFWVMTGNKIPFLVALGLIVLFKSPNKSILRRLGGGLWGLYEWVLGLFGDVMSYLRIFGLGLSSGIIALVVNTIAGMMMEGGSVVGIIGGVLVLLIGHTFNFAMSVLGSTVHSARLQFLEFFGKFLEGGGQPFSPFARTK